MIIIRPYTPQDWLEVCRVHDLAQPGEFEGSCDLRGMTSLAENPHAYQINYSYHKFVACDGDKVVGFVAIDRNCIALLYVEPQYQNRGIGKRLLKLALRLMGSPATTIVMAGNQKALNFYKQQGFQEKSRFKSQVGGYPCQFVRLVRQTLKKVDSP